MTHYLFKRARRRRELEKGHPGEEKFLKAERETGKEKEEEESQEYHAGREGKRP